ncbi:MAG: hypothetical protein RR705_02075 [Lachnospiraceae bacterium]
MKKKKDLYGKQTIYYARTFRHLQISAKQVLPYFVFFVLPCVLLYLLFYSSISWHLANKTLSLLSVVIPASQMNITVGEFLPFFGGVYSVQLPGSMPSIKFVLINIIVSLLLLLASAAMRKSSKAMAIFLRMSLIIHVISCVYFLFWGKYFPYTLSDYSDLYMKQQIGIWLAFMLVAGMATGLTVHSGLKKHITFLAILFYSFVFGCIRYVGFLFLLYQASSLYMASLFFVLGPFFDFLYLVCIYSYFIKRVILRYETRKTGVNWQWM